MWCGEPLTFGPPWRHVTDGTTVRQRDRGDGTLVDDHVATPNHSIHSA
jgi:hypothetical protein